MSAAREQDTDKVLHLSEQMIVGGSKSFAAARHLFAPQTRADAVMLYAWCRHADDVIDGQELGHGHEPERGGDPAARLADLRQATQSALRGETAGDPVFEALHLVVERNEIPHRHPLELIAGFAMDVEGRTYRSFDDTLDYCYHVAGVVGVMMAMIMGVRQASVLDRASDLGLAFQLTNIARDVIDDARAGRCYLPTEWLHEVGIATIDPDNRDQWPALHGLALRLLDCAEPYYVSAYAGIPALAFRSAWAVAAARRVYRDIGQVLRQGGSTAWSDRVSTSQSRKVWLLSRALGDVIATRRGGHEPRNDRDGLYDRP